MLKLACFPCLHAILCHWLHMGSLRCIETYLFGHLQTGAVRTGEWRQSCNDLSLPASPIATATTLPTWGGVR